MPRIGAEASFTIFASIDGMNGEADIGTGTETTEEDNLVRRLRINGAPAKSVDDLTDHLRILWLTPAMDGLFTRPFALVLGRHTYDIFAGYWPQVASDAPHGAIADAFNAATKHVATHRPDTLAWAHSHALDGDVVDALRALKRTDGPDLVIQGSSVLLHQLLAHDVVDELRLLVYPIVLGGGKRLFDDDAQAAAFRLAGTRATPQWSGQLRGDGLALRSLVDGIAFANGELRASLRGEELLKIGRASCRERV